MDLGTRIFNLLKSVTQDQLDAFDHMLKESKEKIYEELEKWEAKYGIDPDKPWQPHKKFAEDRKRKSEKEDFDARAGFRGSSEGSGGGSHGSSRQGSSSGSTQGSYGHSSRSTGGSTGQGLDRQYREDLAVFDLHHPTDLDQLKKARNREVKKYHPDRFQNDPVKQETAKEILQLINTAYERLRKDSRLK